MAHEYDGCRGALYAMPLRWLSMLAVGVALSLDPVT